MRHILMVGDIKQIVSSLSVFMLVFYFKGSYVSNFLPYICVVYWFWEIENRHWNTLDYLFEKRLWILIVFYVFKWFSCQIYNRLGQTLFVVHTFEIHHKYEEYHDVKMFYLVVEEEKKEKSTSKNANEILKSGYVVFRTCWAGISRKSFRI